MHCFNCSGTGTIYGKGTSMKDKCMICNGTGIDTHTIIQEEVINYSIDKTLLDEIAMSVLSGVVSNTALEKFAIDFLDKKYEQRAQIAAYAYMAYDFASAMINERKHRNHYTGLRDSL